LYDRLFKVDDPSAEEDFKQFINPDSLQIIREAILEPALADARQGESYQFIRKGYFCLDNKLSAPGKPIFNRTVTLKDNWKPA
jgi:glutaminyl-tRNA synthetase